MRIISIILLLLFSIPAFAQEQIAMLPPTMCGGGVSAAACITDASPTDMVAQTAAVELFVSTGTDWVATAFVSDGSTICKIEVYLDTSTGSDPTPLSSLAVYIYSDDGTTNCTDGAGCPSTALATFSAISTTGLGAAPGWKASTGTFSGVNTTRYHVVLASDAVSATNKVRWYRDSSCTTESVVYGGTGSTWSNGTVGSCQNVKFYK
jgi:hypothetical protein